MGTERKIERREDIKVIKSHDTGIVIIQTTTTTTDKRHQEIHFTNGLAIRSKDNQKIKEQVKAYGFLGGMVAGVVGGAELIISGVENFNPEQVAIGAGAFILARYMLGSAKKAFYESGLAGREINKIKHTK